MVLTSKNPQANAICERLHLTVSNTLRTLVHYTPPHVLQDAALLVDTALQTAAYSARVAMHGTLKHSPGSLAHHRDMLFDIPLIADMETIRQNRQLIVDERARLSNSTRITRDYRVGERVFIRDTEGGKLSLCTNANPLQIVRVHVNGTVTVRRGPYVTERISIRRLIPYDGP